jgi:Arc/MetJ family transcription regulator
MRTNIDINDILMEKASRLAGAKTKKQIIHDELELFIKINKRKDISDLAGKHFKKSGGRIGHDCLLRTQLRKV